MHKRNRTLKTTNNKAPKVFLAKVETHNAEYGLCKVHQIGDSFSLAYWSVDRKGRRKYIKGERIKWSDIVSIRRLNQSGSDAQARTRVVQVTRSGYCLGSILQEAIAA